MTRSKRRTREEVIREILQRERTNEPLNSLEVENTAAALFGAAVAHFGSWTHALAAAGVDVKSVRRVRPWNRQAVVKHIRYLVGRGVSLRRTMVAERDSGLVAAAGKLLIRPKALNAAGIETEQICRIPIWDRERIIEAICYAVQREP